MTKRKSTVNPVKTVPRKKAKMELYKTAVIKAPVSGSAILSRTSAPPRIISNRNAVVVTNTEALFNIDNPLTFSVNRATIAPFNFRWVDPIARNFSKWRLLQLRFIYVPRCPTTSVGSVVIGLGYDHTDSASTSTTQLQYNFHSITFPVWAGYEGAGLLNNHGATNIPAGSVYTDVDVNRLGGASGPNFYRYVSEATFIPLGGTDKNVYSPGYIDIAREGGLATPITVGTLFAQYHIEFVEPIYLATNV